MKVLFFVLFIVISGKTFGQSLFIQKCQEYKNKPDGIDISQIDWLHARFKTQDCESIAGQIKSFKSFNQIIPSYEQNALENEFQSPFNPPQFNNPKFKRLPNDVWENYRLKFNQDLTLFQEFKNLTHINHDPNGSVSDSNICRILKEIPSIRAITIRYFNPQPEHIKLKDTEINCILKNNLQIYIKGNFLPDEESEKIKYNILGIENYLGDLDSLYQYKSLRYLGLLDYSGKSRLKVLTGIRNLTHLQINLDNVQNPSDVSFLPQLQYLTLNCIKRGRLLSRSNCNSGYLTDISFLNSLTLLKGLDLSWNQIIDVTPISKLKKLKTLNLRMNRIRSIAPILKLDALSFLDISFNNISDVYRIGKLKSLRFLDITKNNIKSFRTLSDLPELTYLSAGQNPYTLKGFNPSTSLKVLNLDASIPYMSPGSEYLETSLSPDFEEENEHGWTKLTLSSHIYDYDEEIIFSKPNESISTFDFNKIVNVEYLSLHANELTSLPNLNILYGLKYLNVGTNLLTDESLKNISTRVEYLVIARNQFQDYKFLQDLTQLMTLDVSFNDIRGKDLKLNSRQLNALVLMGCNLSFLPNLKQSPNIEVLNLGYNNLTTFLTPNLERLEKIYLDNNQLQDIPNFSEYKLLSFVDLQSNKISSLRDVNNLFPHQHILTSIENPPLIFINLRNNEISDLSFLNKENNRLGYILDNNPVDKSLCPLDSINSSISNFCNSI